jgi:hypothetical protein
MVNTSCGEHTAHDDESVCTRAAKFVDSPYYSELELRGGVVRVSFSKYLSWQAMHFLQRSTHFSKTCCRPCLGAPFSWLEKSRNRMGRDMNWILFSAWKSESMEPKQNIRHTVQISSHAISGVFQPWKGASRQEISKWSTVCSTFSRSEWSVVRNSWLAKGRTSKKRPSPHLHKVPTRSNKLSPRTLQTAVVVWRVGLGVICVCVHSKTQEHNSTTYANSMFALRCLYANVSYTTKAKDKSGNRSCWDEIQ